MADQTADDDFVAQALAQAQMAVEEISDEVGDLDNLLVEDVLKLSGGSVVELDKLAGDPVDVLVNGRLVARGEVLVLNDNFCIRVSEIVGDLAPDALLAGAETNETEAAEAAT